jgi:hypothetical protein
VFWMSQISVLGTVIRNLSTVSVNFFFFHTLPLGMLHILWPKVIPVALVGHVIHSDF